MADRRTSPWKSLRGFAALAVISFWISSLSSTARSSRTLIHLVAHLRAVPCSRRALRHVGRARDRHEAVVVVVRNLLAELVGIILVLVVAGEQRLENVAGELGGDLGV
jgi:hypothetical protein